MFDPISVPPVLANMGYTPDVVARRLIDGIQGIRDGENRLVFAKALSLIPKTVIWKLKGGGKDS